MTKYKPEDLLPFDLEQARAGAKLSTAEGWPVRIGLWDARQPDPLIGIIEAQNDDELYSWMNDGMAYLHRESPSDLRIVREKKWNQLHVEIPPFDTWGNILRVGSYEGPPVNRVFMRQSDAGDIEVKVGDERVAIPREGE